MSWSEPADRIAAMMKEDGFSPPDEGETMYSGMTKVADYIDHLREQIYHEGRV